MAVGAAALQPFAEEPFQSALAAGKPVLIQIHADWCPTCRAQAPILDALATEAPYAGITRFRVDFDSQAQVVKKLGASAQSTLILFGGGKELARSVGATAEPAIRALLDHAR
ncbi:MAG TPA: thioredoxin family protein [Burkholderiales bacterium]